MYRLTDPKVTPNGTSLFIHVMGYVIIRLYELHCRGQKEVILNQKMLPSVYAMAHTYFLFIFCCIRPFINLHYISYCSTSNIL